MANRGRQPPTNDALATGVQLNTTFNELYTKGTIITTTIMTITQYKGQVPSCGIVQMHIYISYNHTKQTSEITFLFLISPPLT